MARSVLAYTVQPREEEEEEGKIDPPPPPRTRTDTLRSVPSLATACRLHHLKRG